MKIIIFSVVGVAVMAFSYFLYSLNPASTDTAVYPLTVPGGEGFQEVAQILAEEGLIKSAISFKVYALISGAAHRLRPGKYLISPSWSARTIVKSLVSGPPEDIAVTIIEGETVADINAKLRILGILREDEKFSQNLEGYLFPDTYRFFPDSPLTEIEKKFASNFNKKVSPLINSSTVLTMASLVEKEVPFEEDRFLVSGILWKRLNIDMPLQADATICYAKKQSVAGCYPLRKEDFAIDSLYNTYKYYGLPPSPIGNPGLSAIKAALNPQASDYWYYLSDPKTKKTIFAKTLDEHNENRARYLP